MLVEVYHPQFTRYDQVITVLPRVHRSVLSLTQYSQVSTVQYSVKCHSTLKCPPFSTLSLTQYSQVSTVQYSVKCHSTLKCPPFSTLSLPQYSQVSTVQYSLTATVLSSVHRSVLSHCHSTLKCPPFSTLSSATVLSVSHDVSCSSLTAVVD